MDAIIFRKPGTVFNLTFNDVVEKIQKGNNPETSDETQYPTLSYVCENFPKNSFVRVDANGTFYLYHIRGDAEVICGSKCITNMRMLEARWCVTQNLDDVFCALDFDTGNPIELSEVRRRVSEEHGGKTYYHSNRRNRGNSRGRGRSRNYRSNDRQKGYYINPPVSTNGNDENVANTEENTPE